MRKFNYGLLIGLGGMITCAATMLIGLWELTIASKEFVRFVPYPIARLALAAASTVAGSEEARTEAAFWIYQALWVVHIAAFAAAYWVRVHPDIKRSKTTDVLLLIVQLIAAVSGQKPLLYLFSFEVAFVLPARKAAAWLSFGLMLCAAVDLPPALLDTGVTAASNVHVTLLNLGYLAMYGIMHFMVGLLAARERSHRRQLASAHTELAGANAELLATQMLLSGSTRASERMRIARDLHDSIGHSLMAQSLHLDLAMRKCRTDAIGPLRAASELAQTLLAEIRALVSTERGQGPVNLRQSLESLRDDIASPRITFNFGDGLQDLLRTEATRIFQCIQEAILDAVRHAGSSKLHIALAGGNNGASVEIAGDGREINESEFDAVFANLREYVGKTGGTLESSHAENGGFVLHVLLSHTEEEFA